jgi:hypothetical protein
MLESVAIALVLLWLLGWVSSVTMGGLIHLLLVIALVVVLVRVIQGKRPRRSARHPQGTTKKPAPRQVVQANCCGPFSVAAAYRSLPLQRGGPPADK